MHWLGGSHKFCEMQRVLKLTREQKECPHGKNKCPWNISEQIGHRIARSRALRPGTSGSGPKSVGSGIERSRFSIESGIIDNVGK